MPVTYLPSTFRAVELQLAIQIGPTSPRRVLNKSRGQSSPFAERWGGQIAFAAVSGADAQAQAAALEAQDGRVSPFGILLKQGFATHANSFAGIVAADSSEGADRIALSTNSGATVDLLRGTLLQLGTPGDAGYQLIEVLKDVSVRSSSEVEIAPRLRRTINAGTAVTGGDVTAMLVLAEDAVNVAFSIAQGMASINVVEALL